MGRTLDGFGEEPVVVMVSTGGDEFLEMNLANLVVDWMQSGTKQVRMLHRLLAEPLGEWCALWTLLFTHLYCSSPASRRAHGPLM